jgi:hypothetical protein
VGVLLVAIPVATSSAEIRLQLTINGDIDELIEVLEKLRGMGVDVAVEPSNSELSKIQVRSVTDDRENRKAAAPPPEPEEVGLEFLWARAQPKLADPGSTVLIEVKLSDPWRDVETIGAALKGVKLEFDLLDTGDRGDRVARDGIWSFGLNLPLSADSRQYSIRVVAYDKNGDVVSVENERGERVPLTTEMSFEVSR